MPRRASSKVQPIWIVAIAAAAILAVGLGFLLENQGGDAFRTVPELNIQDYLSDARSLRGNTYKVKGMIFQSLGTPAARAASFPWKSTRARRAT